MDCIFCKIASGEIPVQKIYEDEDIIAFNDINPEAPMHLLIIPKEHISSLQMVDVPNAGIIAKIFCVIPSLTKKLGIDESGYRVVTNCGEQGGQTVMHLHFHLLGGRNLGWPPG